MRTTLRKAAFVTVLTAVGACLAGGVAFADPSDGGTTDTPPPGSIDNPDPGRNFNPGIHIDLSRVQQSDADGNCTAFQDSGQKNPDGSTIWNEVPCN